jgi:integrase
VKLWRGKSGEKFWKAEWRLYVEGHEKPKHRAQTWPCSRYTKSKAQEECDRMLRDETGGALRPDGSMTVAEFWEKIFYPIVSRRLTRNSKRVYESAFRGYINPALGNQELQHVLKHGIEAMLGKMADEGKGEASLRRAFMLVHVLFSEAVENNYVAKNPARRIVLPNCKRIQEIEPLTESQVRALFENTEGRDLLMWRILLLTGVRIGELLALRKSDIEPIGLRIDESSDDGRPSTTKNKKTRYAPIPDSLRGELEDWFSVQEADTDLIFPNARGGMLSRASDVMQSFLNAGRTAAGVPHLTFRHCRTTFATLYEGDPRDRQAILGHHSEEFTRRVYQKPILDRQKASVNALEARFRGKVVTMPVRDSA